MTDATPPEPIGSRFREFQAGLDQPDGQRHRKPGRGRGGGDGEQLNVPPADFSSYYGRPILKAPVWKHDIAGYLFTGGLAAGGSLIGAGAQLTGRPGLRQVGRWTALGGVAASAYLLVHDLGRPTRFHHMLRVAKLTSPMSVGTWILTVFGPLAGAAAVAELAPLLPQHGVLGLARRAAPPVGNALGLAAAPPPRRWPPTPGCCSPTPPYRPGTTRTRTCRSSSVAARSPPPPGSASSRHPPPRPRRCGGWPWPPRPSSWPAVTAWSG
ncbi:hypothetical protein GCM10027614_03220 [Micromonospora vulcania]